MLQLISVEHTDGQGLSSQVTVHNGGQMSFNQISAKCKIFHMSISALSKRMELLI